MTKDEFLKLNPCREAVEWLEDYTDMEKAWNECERGDWLLWLVGKLSGKPGCEGRKKLVLCTCECARLALPHVKKGDTRPLKAIETAEQWARNENGVTISDVNAAADAAETAAVAADAAADAAAAYAAAADAAYAAAYAADAAEAAAVAADVAAARGKVLKECANIARNHYNFKEI